MENFIKAYDRFMRSKPFGCYRFCWIHIDAKKGTGIYSVLEIFDEELASLDCKKCEIIVK